MSVSGHVQAIRTHPDPILYRRAAEATEEDFARGFVAQVHADLRATMDALQEWTGKRALGLAAPQIGYGIRIFVLRPWPQAFINPTIEYVPGKPHEAIEECFSLPGVQVVVGRTTRIKMRYRTESGDERAMKMRDKDARAAQHEYDHLDGITIVQRSSGPQDATIAGAVDLGREGLVAVDPWSPE